MGYCDKRLYSKTYSSELGLENIIKWEVLPLKKGERLSIKFLSTDSPYLQGVRVAVDSSEELLDFNGALKREYWFWENEYRDKPIELRALSDCYVSLYNVCYRQKDKTRPGIVRSLGDYSGMLLDVIGDNTFVYHCNDLIKNTEFKSLVFEVKIIH